MNSSLNGKANTADLSNIATSGSYSDLLNTPAIPVNTSQLSNDSGYISNIVADTNPQLGGTLNAQGNVIDNYTQNIIDITGTAFTLSDDNSGAILRTTNASAVTLTVPNTLPIGFVCTIIQKGAGVITFTGAATLNNRQSHIATAGQFSSVTLISDVSGEIILAGDTA